MGSILAKEEKEGKETKLFKHIKAKRWNKAIQRCKSKPSSASQWVLALADDGQQKSVLLPIHLACWLQPPVEAIRALIDANPNGLGQKDTLNRVPLHTAVSEMASIDVVQLLLKRYPDGVKVSDKNGETPLHLAMMSEEMDPKVIEALLFGYPVGVWEANSEGVTPLVLAQERMNDMNGGEVLQILKDACTRAGKAGKTNDIKLNSSKNHDAAMEAEADRLLEEARKEQRVKVERHRQLQQEARRAGASMVVQSDNMIVLSSEATNELVLDPANTQSSKEVASNRAKAKPSNVNRLYNFISRKDWSGAYRWLQTHSDEADQIYLHDDGTKRYPLYEALCGSKNKQNHSLAVLTQFMVDKSYRGVITSDNKGRIPLHLAAMFCRVDVCDALVKGDYRVTSEKPDNDLNLPLHLAYMYGNSQEVKSKLISVNPLSLQKKNRKGLTPPMCAPDYDHASSEQLLNERIEAFQKNFIGTGEENKNWFHTFLGVSDWEGVKAACLSKPDSVAHWIIRVENDMIVRNLPLHYIFSSSINDTSANSDGAYKRVPLEVVEALIRAYPNAIFSKNHHGKLPLHLFIEMLSLGEETNPYNHEQSLSILDKMLQDYFSRSANVKDDRDMWPVDYLIRLKDRNDAISSYISRLRECFDDTKEREEEAAYDEPSPEVVMNASVVDKEIVTSDEVNNTEVYDNVDDKNSNRMDGKNKEQVQQQTKENKKKKKRGNRKKKRVDEGKPLQNAMDKFDWCEIVEIIKGDPNLAAEWLIMKLGPKFSWKRLPLHEISRIMPEKAAVEALYEAYPDAIKIGESMHNRLPLHLAAGEGAFVDIIEYLIELYPEAVRTPDNEGCLPIHICCMAGADIKVFWTLLAAYPEAVEVKTDADEDVIQLAKSCNFSNKKSILATIENTRPKNADKYCDIAADNHNDDGTGRFKMKIAHHAEAEDSVVDFRARRDQMLEFQKSDILKKIVEEGNDDEKDEIKRELEVDQLYKESDTNDLEASHAAIIDEFNKSITPPLDNGVARAEELIKQVQVSHTSAIQELNGSIASPIVSNSNNARKEKLEEIQESYDKQMDEINRGLASPGDPSTSAETTSPNNKQQPLIPKSDEDFKSVQLRATKSSQEQQDEEDIRLGLFVFEEKKGSTVLWSQLSKLVEMEDWKRVTRRCEIRPIEASMWIIGNVDGLVWRRLPLHEACASEDVEDVEGIEKSIEALLRAFPDGARYRDNEGYLPLHIACLSKMSFNIIDLLLRTFSEAVHIRDRDEGSLPRELVLKAQDYPDKKKVLQILS